MEEFVFSQEAKNFKLGKYRHYKGREYLSLYIARQSETLEELVVYQDISVPEKIWCRPLGMFLEWVNVDSVSVPRFEYFG
jgi:cyclomaltodextrinase